MSFFVCCVVQHKLRTLYVTVAVMCSSNQVYLMCYFIFQNAQATGKSWRV